MTQDPFKQIRETTSKALRELHVVATESGDAYVLSLTPRLLTNMRRAAARQNTPGQLHTPYSLWRERVDAVLQAYNYSSEFPLDYVFRNQGDRIDLIIHGPHAKHLLDDLGVPTGGNSYVMRIGHKRESPVAANDHNPPKPRSR